MQYYEGRIISPTRKFFNTLSYVLNIILLLCLLWCYNSRSKDNTNPAPSKEDKVREEINIRERIASVILKKERAELPLKNQKYGSNGITIDSLVFTGDNEGYLACTWNGYTDYLGRFKSKKKVVYIEVENIYTYGEKVQWSSDWATAYNSIALGN